jgi:hypothetical protein
MQITHFPFPPPGEMPVAQAEPYPAPLLTSDMPYDGPTSKPAADLLKLALAHGWTGRITYAKGCVPHATTGRPGTAPKFSEAVRLARGHRRALAVRTGGSWDSLWTWSATQFLTRHRLLNEFKAALVTRPVDNPVDNQANGAIYASPEA